MIFYRVEASFSVLDAYGKQEAMNLGPYMNMGQVIEARNDTHSFNDSEDWVDENEVVSESFYQMSSRHPMPDEDQRELFYESCSYVCGFDSLEKLRRWFCNKDLLTLYKTGFMIAKYETDDYSDFVSNDYQDVFSLSKSQMIEFIDISDLLNA